MHFPSTISAGIAKMESKFMKSTNNGHNPLDSNHGDPETRSTISSVDLLPGYSPRPMESTALTVAKLITRTLLLITLIISLLVLITVYMQTKAATAASKCEYGLSATAARETRNGAYFEPLTAESGNSGNDGGNGGKRIPISIRMSGRAGDLLNSAPNGKGHVNCVIERKTANQIIASEPKKLITPYGNITTDPRLIHLTGEKLVFSCHSGEKGDNGKGEPTDEKEKDIIIITNNREVIDPTRGGGSSGGDEDSGADNGDASPMVENSDRKSNLSASRIMMLGGGIGTVGGSGNENENIDHPNSIDRTDDRRKAVMKQRTKRSPVQKKELSCNCSC